MSDGKNGFEKTKHNFPYKWTLKDAVFTKDKGKVFSCFFGYGTTGVVARELNRFFIGIEKEKSYYEMSVERCGL